ncbi:MAG: outer membrane beta-barrel family protein, partial [Ignavibacteriaceae bacterium]|nr:outer membrane beta-barrel family protein [Ignavibacteriaceae bacterium]
AEDLVKKMPGVVVQDGKVQVQGEEVKKVLVDGREFFGDDPNAVLKNLPAEVIEKIQVFDEQSEQSRFTGFDDGNTTKTLNIITRLRFRDGTFGKLSGGYGNEEKYYSGGNINYFNEDTRLSLLGQLNNINEQNFSSEDLLGVMSGGSSGRQGNFRRPGGGGGGGRGSGGSSNFGGGSSDFLVDSKDGLTKTKSFGLNYSDKFGESVEVTSSYFFNSTDNNSVSFLNRDYLFNSAAGQKYVENNAAVSNNLNHRFNMRLNYEIDSMNSILFRPKVTYQANDGNSGLSGYTSGAQLINSVNNNFKSTLDAIDAAAELLYRHRFEERGRTLSLNINSNYKKNTGDNKLFSESIYYDNSVTSDTMDQTANLDSDGKGGSINISYTEPVSENGILLFNSGYSLSREESEKKTYDLSMFQYNLDTSLSNVYKKEYTTQSYGTGYRYRYEDFSFNINLNYNISKLDNNQDFPFISGINKTFYSVLPSAMLRYRFSRESDLRFFYRTNNNDPSVSQLQNVLDNTNPLLLSIGNPLLKQDYRHSLNLRYSQVNPGSMSAMFFLISATFTNNYIANKTIAAVSDTTVLGNIFLNRGTQLKIPVNMDGYFNLRSFISYGLPVEFIKSNINLNVNGNYSNTPTIINEAKSFSKSSSLGFGVVISSNISENFDFTLSSQSSVTNLKGGSAASSKNSYFNQNSGAKIVITLPFTFVMHTDFNHIYSGGLSGDYNPNSYQWNFSLGKKLFNETSELRFTAIDILNKTTNIKRTTTDIYTEDITSNVLGRYYMISFIYNLRAF